MAAMSNAKETKIEELNVDGKLKFRCLECFRILSSKHNALHHLHLVHNMSPVRRKKKLYLFDDSIDVPERTARRWRTALFRSNESDDSLFHSSESDSDLEGRSSANASGRSDPNPLEFKSNSETDFQSETTKHDSESASETDSKNALESDSESVSETDSESASETDSESASETVSEIASETDSESASEQESDSGIDKADPSNGMDDLAKDMDALKLLSCFRRHNLTAIACKDLTETLLTIFPDAEKSNILNYDYLLSLVQKHPIKELHYCDICFGVFEENPEVVSCETPNCSGRRYNRDGQPNRCFIFADLQTQLIDLLQTPGIWNEIKEQKQWQTIRKEMNPNDDTITDIYDGVNYRRIYNDWKEDAVLLTALINTDGVNLYSSSKVELWPIFLAINELSPKSRFSRDNLLLIAIWQGKGKPPFKPYFECLSPQLNMMANDGITVSVDGETFTLKLKTTCGVFDLPAKAAILNMTYFNGKYACITCENPGHVVKQGKGTARCFPFKNDITMRSNESVLNCMQQGTSKKPIKGLKGISGLVSIDDFDLVEGILPDYMHGVLLGITNMLLSKWFSPTQSKKPYFIGKDLKVVSRRLQNIQPPSTIERLPRDLEKHYKSLKATELQAFLLFYGIPCLIGILPDRYLHHFSCLSEAIYILLGDSITEIKLERAKILLEMFYTDFGDLYGLGSCGLNVHNTCHHLVQYVKLWGPLWAWSCFGFEDNNAMLLQSVHGTGNVTKQVMLCKQVEATLRRKSVKKEDSRTWKITQKSKNCNICGKLITFSIFDGVDPEILDALQTNGDDLKILHRININGKQFCSSGYKRMKKRICSYVLYDGIEIGIIQYFVLKLSTNMVFAVIEKLEALSESSICEFVGGKQLIPVRNIGVKTIEPVSCLEDTLVYLKTCAEVDECVVSMPSRHGHSIFK